MGFSKFEFRPIGSFLYIQGYLLWTVQKKHGMEHTVFNRWSRTHGNLGAPFKLIQIGNISIISDVIHIRTECYSNFCNLSDSQT